MTSKDSFWARNMDTVSTVREVRGVTVPERVSGGGIFDMQGFITVENSGTEESHWTGGEEVEEGMEEAREWSSEIAVRL